MKFVNVVLLTNYHTSFDLDLLATQLDKQGYVYKYDVWAFPALRLKKSKKNTVSAVIYSSGKVILHTKSIDDIDDTVKVITNILDGIGYKGLEPTTRITNLVAQFQFGGIDLHEFSKNEGVVYDPQIFPGANIKHGRISFLVFQSGSVICAGCKSTDQTMIEHAWIKKLLGGDEIEEV